MNDTEMNDAEQHVNGRELAVVFAGVLIAILLAALDQMIFGTALPTIVGDLGGVDRMLWVTTAYLLAVTIVMPIYGKLGDLVGHKVMFLGALVIFLAGSVMGGLAGNMSFMIAARAVQGVGGGGLMILAQASSPTSSLHAEGASTWAPSEPCGASPPCSAPFWEAGSPMAWAGVGSSGSTCRWA